MNQFQQTISKSISFSGTGLHTGEFASVCLIPAQPGSGISFRRIGEDGFPATIEYVSNTIRSTNLGTSLSEIHTVEHLMAAISALQIDNLIIEVHGPEIPILDGSAKPFVSLLRSVGLVMQPGLREIASVPEPITFCFQESVYKLEPSSDFHVAVELDFAGTPLHQMTAEMNSWDLFESEIAPCRTFCFQNEIELLRKQGLIKGGNLENALVVDLEPRMNWKFQNEPARHKLLDLVGDLALIGRPLMASIKATRPGHTANIAFAKHLVNVLELSVVS